VGDLITKTNDARTSASSVNCQPDEES
jgi:hypothetical protein